MFSSTYDRVQEKSEEYWNIQFCQLVCDYVDASLFPAPLNFIEYIIKLFQYFCKSKTGIYKIV